MYSLIVIWLMFIHRYSFLVINPICFHGISQNTVEKQQISKNSKLRYIYLNKKAGPQLKCIAIESIIFFF